ncbi:hypothetical protein Syun_011199 [Stephania yunnanensis]|uniref:Uncharacterized protein n=1 Tax=Stephania yunnanensis TaxID=152371 RepID=A0AAP0JXU4_9MAGN
MCYIQWERPGYYRDGSQTCMLLEGKEEEWWWAKSARKLMKWRVLLVRKICRRRRNCKKDCRFRYNPESYARNFDCGDNDYDYHHGFVDDHYVSAFMNTSVVR